MPNGSGASSSIEVLPGGYGEMDLKYHSASYLQTATEHGRGVVSGGWGRGEEAQRVPANMLNVAVSCFYETS